MADSDLERSEQATGRRLEEARRHGQVPRSRELVLFAGLMAGGGALVATASGLIGRLEDILRRGLSISAALAKRPETLGPHLHALSVAALTLMLPFLVVAAVAAIAANIALSGWLFSLEALAPDFTRINPLAGISRLFSLSSAVETAKAVLKTLLIGGVAAWVIWRQLADLAVLPFESTGAALAHVGHMAGATFLIIAGSLALVVLIDVPWQLYDFAERMKMTKEEVKQEAKESEGNPEVKGKIRRLQIQAARRRMMAEVPKADVVVTNPTRYAVALQYRAGMPAPKVLATGHLLVAQAIRDLAEQHGVPILQAPPLARALYHHCEPGQDVPSALYEAVAEVMAWIFRLREPARPGLPPPAAPTGVRVPAHLDPEGEAE